MIPVRWKIFRVANYLQLIGTTVMLCFFSYTFLSFSYGGSDSGYFLLFFLALCVVIINNCLNIHIMHRHYPDKSLGGGKKTLLVLLIIFYILVNIGLILIAAFAISQMTEDGYRVVNSDLVAFGILVFDILLGIYILIFEISLPGALARNDRRHMEQLLDEIGKPG